MKIFKMNKVKYYFLATRPETLFLSISGIVLGAMLSNNFNWLLFILAILTTLSIHAICNVANDLGDAERGTDSNNSPGKIVGFLQNKILSVSDYKWIIKFLTAAAMILGALTVYVAIPSFSDIRFWLFLLFGLIAIWAAVFYTLGKRPYGYVGFLGDIFCFLTFGLLSTMGMNYLMNGHLSSFILLPATSLGLLIVGVLNVNNLRDCVNDVKFNKKTLVVRLGENIGKVYQFMLVLGGIGFMALYAVLVGRTSVTGYVFLLTMPIFVFHLQEVAMKHNKDLDKQLPLLSIAIFIFAILSGIS